MKAIERKAALSVAALVVVVVAASWTARVREGRRALAESDAAAARGDFVEAVFQARAAADARCPFCSASELGYARLYGIAKDAEGRNDTQTAIAAWRAVRAASLATSPFVAEGGRRERAEQEIARLGHKMDTAAAAAGAPSSAAATEEKLRAAHAESHVPGSATVALLALASVVFLAGAAAFAFERATRTAALAAIGAGAGLAAAALLLF